MKDNESTKEKMRVLIVPMAAMAETCGPSSRCRMLASAFVKAGIETATCMAEDVNYRRIEGVKNYFLDIPMPLGMPKLIATRTFPIAQKLGITSRKEVKNFDQVLMFTGNLSYRYLKKSVESIRRAIKEFKPQIVYSEFNVSAVIAAKLERITLFATTSYPTRPEFANDPGLSSGLNKLLEEYKLSTVGTALELIDYADQEFCPSIIELEPIKNGKVHFCGAFKTGNVSKAEKNKILVYMGNGTVPAKKMLKVIQSAFLYGKYEVFVASGYLREEKIDNIHVAPRWDFNTLLNETVLFINHGGQNSIVDGLLFGVPQIVVPGKVFERRYNAKSVEENGCGAIMEYSEFVPGKLRSLAEELIDSQITRDNACRIGNILSEAGGTEVIVSEIREFERSL